MSKNINELVLNSTTFYYKHILSNHHKYVMETSNITLNKDNIYFGNFNKTCSFEILSIYNTKNHVWTWSWALYNIESELIQVSKELLNYGLKLELTNNDLTDEHLYLKSLLVNSRFKVETYIEMRYIKHIISYLLKKSNQFIYEYQIPVNDITLKLLLLVYNI